MDRRDIAADAFSALLKGNGLAETWPQIWPLAVFLVIAAAVALNRYRKTLD